MRKGRIHQNHTGIQQYQFCGKWPFYYLRLVGMFLFVTVALRNKSLLLVVNVVCVSV